MHWYTKKNPKYIKNVQFKANRRVENAKFTESLVVYVGDILGIFEALFQDTRTFLYFQ